MDNKTQTSKHGHVFVEKRSWTWAVNKKDLPTHLEEYSGHDDRPDGGGGGDHIGVRCFKEIGQKMDLIQSFHADDENDQWCERNVESDTG